MSRPRMLALGFLAAIAGCASSPDGPIDYQVSGGLTGHGDGTVMHIEPDGRTTRQTLAHGTETGILAAATIEDLHAKIAAAQFESLPPTIGCNSCTDGYVYHVSVQLDGAVRSVAADQTTAWPDTLKAVIDTLKQIAAAPLGAGS